jgi:hypothetical protein
MLPISFRFPRMPSRPSLYVLGTTIITLVLWFTGIWTTPVDIVFGVVSWTFSTTFAIVGWAFNTFRNWSTTIIAACAVYLVFFLRSFVTSLTSGLRQLNDMREGYGRGPGYGNGNTRPSQVYNQGQWSSSAATTGSEENDGYEYTSPDDRAPVTFRKPVSSGNIRPSLRSIPITTTDEYGNTLHTYNDGFKIVFTPDGDFVFPFDTKGNSKSHGEEPEPQSS